MYKLTSFDSASRWLASLALGATFVLTSGHAGAQWNPNKPITIIVPWAAGGSTDQVTRVTAGEVEKALNQKVVIVNQPGASGSIGTKTHLKQPKTATPGPQGQPRTSAPIRCWACSTPR